MYDSSRIYDVFLGSDTSNSACTASDKVISTFARIFMFIPPLHHTHVLRKSEVSTSSHDTKKYGKKPQSNVVPRSAERCDSQVRARSLLPEESSGTKATVSDTPTASAADTTLVNAEQSSRSLSPNQSSVWNKPITLSQNDDMNNDDEGDTNVNEKLNPSIV